MNKLKFSLADVMTVLTAVAFGFVCFLGSNFYTLGDTKKSVIFAVIITVVLAGLAYLAKWLKGVEGNFKNSHIAEIAVLVLFTGLLAFFTYSPFSHYFTVSDRKEEIQSQLSKNITQAQDMFSNYEDYANRRKNLYRRTLESNIKAGTDFEKFGIEKNGVSFETQLNNKMLTIQSDLFPTNYTDTINNNGLKQVAKNWLADGKEKATGWKPIGTVRVVNNIEEKSIGWRNDLVNYSIIREKGENEEYVENYSSDLSFKDLKANFTNLGKPTPLSIGLAVLAWLLMLLSYLISKRSTKTTVCKTTNKGEFDIDY
jgi:Tfp pilus assembly protein PilE